MWKYIRYIIYISVLTACLTAAYKARDVIIMPYVYDYIHKSTGKDIRFDYFYISPLQHGIVVANINYEDKISVKKTLIKFSFFKILKHIKTPVNYIKSVELSDIGISVDDILKNQNSADENIPASESIPFALPDMPVDIQASGISLIKNSKETKIEGVQMSLSRSSITFSASFSALNSRIAVNSSMTLTRGGLYNTDSSISSEGDINVLAGAKGTIDIFSFDFKQNVNVKKMYYKSFDISGVSSVAEKENGGLKFKANGKFGKIEFLSDASGESSASANIDLSRINKDFGGLLSARFSHKDTGSKINVKAEGIRAFNFDIGSFNLDGEADENGNSSALCDYGGKSVILMNYSPGGNYSAEIVSGGKTGGTFRGNIKTGAFAADMKDADISEMPFMGFLDADPEGKITAEGSIDEHSGKINFVLKDLRTKMIDKTDLYGSVSRNAGMYVFNFYKSDKSVVFNNVIRDGDILSTDFKFVNTDISNVLRTFGYTENKIQGMANGRIKYEKGGTTEFDLNIFDGVIYGNRFKKLDSKGDINMKRVSIEQFILKDNENVTRAYISALFGFTEGSPDSEFHMKLKDVKVAGAKVNGEILFNGKRSGGGEVKGNFSGKGVNISGVSFPDLSADSLISAKRFSLSELKSGNGFSGNFRADFSKDNLSGTLNFRNTDIEGLYSDLSAAVNSTVKLSGSFKNPSAKITAGFKKGTYLGIPFSFDADLTLESEKISVKKLNLISEKTKISVNGVYSKIGELDVVFDKISENLINKFVGFVTPFRGDLSGSGALIQTEGRKHLKMFLTGENTYIKKLKLSDFKSDIEIYKTGIYMSSASAKIADSEIKASGGSFDLKTGEYGLNFSLVNTHAGPADMFGDIILSGVMDKQRGGSKYSGTVTLDNFWINRYKLSRSEFNYFIHNKTFEFKSARLKPGMFKSSGTVAFTDGVSVKDFYVEYENSSFLANAEIAGENIKAGVKGKNIDLEFLADAFDLPVPMSGAADIGADYEKDALKEAASVKAYSSGGTVTEIPYDNFEIEIAAENNIAEIKKAALYKRNEIEVSVSGFFPFGSGLNSSSQTAQSPVNISYSVEDQKMALLKYVSEGNVEPRSGRLSLKGTVKGSFDKISNNGQFTIAGGAFDSQKYVGKVRDFNADISIVDNLITVNKFFAKSGSGLLTGSGTVFLESFTPQKFDLRFYTDDKGIPVKIPELAIPSFIGSSVLLRDYSSGEPRFDVTLTGSAEKPKIAGWVLLENTRFTFPSADKSSGGGGGVLPEGTEFDLELRAAKNTRYENSFADAWINGSLFLRGAKGSLAADGVIDTQRGVIQYLGIEFNIINVKIEVIGNHVYITAEGETEAYSPNKAGSEIIVLAIDRSDINSLNVRFYSRDDPALDSQTALARVTKTEQTTAVSSSERILGIISEFDLRQQALRLFDSGFATPLTRTVLRRTGLVDNFKVSYVSADTRDPALEQDTSLASLLLGTKYSVEKNLTNQFLLGYSLTFDRYNQMERSLDLKHEIEMRYRIGSNLFLSGSYELESESSLHRPDRKLMLQHQIRFGLPVRKQPGD